MDIYEALYTTRSMRRLRPDPIPDDVQARILDAAIRAPSPGNSQDWRFLLVDDPTLKERLAAIYRRNFEQTAKVYYAGKLAAAEAAPHVPENAAFLRVMRSSTYLAEHWAEVPLFLFGFARNDRYGASVIPALWSAQLAARAEGIGSTFTTILSLKGPEEPLRLLGVPQDEGWAMAGCVAMGYPTGRWGIAPRLPVDRVAARNGWHGPLGFTVPEPLWHDRVVSG
jgi:nitroreductase